MEDVVCLRPGGVLAGRLGDYVGYKERLAGPVQLREIPSSRVVLAVAFGDPIRFRRSPHEPASVHLTSFAAGLHDGVAMAGLGGLQHGVLIQLRPLEAYSIFRLPMHLISNNFVDLKMLLGRTGSQLPEQLAEATNWPRRFEILNTTLTDLMSTGPAADPAVEWAWRRLRVTAGNTRITELAERLGWSRRHLARRFHEQIGLTPKTVARIFRFEHASALLTDGSRPLAEIAIEAGYSDQAHLSREIRAFAQCTPGEFTAPLRPTAPSRRAMSHSFKP